MKPTKKEFKKLKNIAISLLGMSGVGKTYLANILRKENWYHYSGDYRIGSHYLNEHITNNIKKQMMSIPFIKKLLLTDSIYIGNNISFNNLDSISTYLGKIGDPNLGGLSYLEFKKRQKQFYNAEYNAMLDVPQFIENSKQIYEYNFFVNDAGGSLCEFYDTEVIDILSQNTIIIYIAHDQQTLKDIIKRSKASPKPMFYSEEFLEKYIELYKKKEKIKFNTLIDPNQFINYIFPKLIAYRKTKYEKIAKKYGYTIPVSIIKKINSSKDFINLIENYLEN